MGLSGKALQIAVIIIFATVACAAATMVANPGCRDKCGGVEIPFPFGMTEGCFLDDGHLTFIIICNVTDDSALPMTGKIPVTRISIENHQLHVLQWVARDCYYWKNSKAKDVFGARNQFMDPENSGSLLRVSDQFTISNSKNKFIVLGCDTKAYLRGYQKSEAYTIGCSSQCPSLSNVVDGSCSGVGCCEVGFPDGLKNISMTVESFNNHSEVNNFNPCGYAFVVEKGEFNFSSTYLKNLTRKKLPLVLDWAVGNQTCEKARNERYYACKDNSDCINHNKTQGYYCQCKQGYQGNPYLNVSNGGCQDIDECRNQTLNNCTNICTNAIGSYNCSCPKWYRGDGKKNGKGCSADFALGIKISIGK